jgi:hypothetical protein
VMYVGGTLLGGVAQWLGMPGSHLVGTSAGVAALVVSYATVLAEFEVFGHLFSSFRSASARSSSDGPSSSSVRLAGRLKRSPTLAQPPSALVASRDGFTRANSDLVTASGGSAAAGSHSEGATSPADVR